MSRILIDGGLRIRREGEVKTPAAPSDKDALVAALLERIEGPMAQNAALMAENAPWNRYKQG